MPQEYVVQAGEHLSGIAEQFGFDNVETIWNDPANEHLRESRESPELLLEGDVVVIPDKKPMVAQRATGSSYDFQVHLETLKVKLRLLGFDGEPLASASCRLEVSSRELEATTDGDGIVEFDVWRTDQEAVVVTDAGSFPLRLGHLDPVSETSGVEKRLINLDYLDGPVGGSEPAIFQQAVARFQSDNDLEASGAVDQDTLDALANVYGS